MKKKKKHALACSVVLQAGPYIRVRSSKASCISVIVNDTYLDER